MNNSPHFTVTPEGDEFLLEWWNGDRKVSAYFPMNSATTVLIVENMIIRDSECLTDALDWLNKE